MNVLDKLLDTVTENALDNVLENVLENVLYNVLECVLLLFSFFVFCLSSAHYSLCLRLRYVSSAHYSLCCLLLSHMLVSKIKPACLSIRSFYTATNCSLKQLSFRTIF